MFITLSMNFAYWLPSVTLFYLILYFSLRNRTSFPTGYKNAAIMFVVSWSVMSFMGGLFGANYLSGLFNAMGILVFPLGVVLITLFSLKNILKKNGKQGSESTF